MEGKILEYALQVLAQLPALIEAGIDVSEFLEKKNAQLKDMVENKRNPTDAEWDELNAEIDEKRRKLHS